MPRLRAIAAERTGDKRIYLRADGANAYERVAQVMGALNAGGFPNIGLVTDARRPALGDGQPTADPAWRLGRDTAAAGHAGARSATAWRWGRRRRARGLGRPGAGRARG